MASEKISKEKFVELYGDVKVKFQSYWKYTFLFYGETLNGEKVSVNYGGNSDDIYKFDVTADLEISLKEFYEVNSFDSAYVYKDGEEIYICY